MCVCVCVHTYVQMAVDQRAAFVVSPCCVGELWLAASYSLT
jgi:hypothetical protein